jgi:hypothetical protein
LREFPFLKNKQLRLAGLFLRRRERERERASERASSKNWRDFQKVCRMPLEAASGDALAADLGA